MIFPEIFDGLVMGFFTDREVGTAVEGITGRKVYFPLQKHTGKVVPFNPDLTSTAADAVITDRRNILLGVQTADCVPILLLDRVNMVIGAVHAGWRGTSEGILKKALTAMREWHDSDMEEVLIAIGPAIGWCCYEVGEEVAHAVSKETGSGDYLMVKDGRSRLDLQKAAMCQALSMGVMEEHISITEECTCCHPDRYYSYRHGADPSGRQGGFIGMP